MFAFVISRSFVIAEMAHRICAVTRSTFDIVFGYSVSVKDWSSFACPMLTITAYLPICFASHCFPPHIVYTLHNCCSSFFVIVTFPFYNTLRLLSITINKCFIKRLRVVTLCKRGAAMLENLKRLRELSGTTQRQLAEAIGVSQQSVNKYENHNIEPDIETLIRIADYFNTSVDCVIGHGEDRISGSNFDTLELSAVESELIRRYRLLDPKQRKCIETVIDSYI